MIKRLPAAAAKGKRHARGHARPAQLVGAWCGRSGGEGIVGDPAVIRAALASAAYRRAACRRSPRHRDPFVEARCSISARHQKVIEEDPSAVVSPGFTASG